MGRYSDSDDSSRRLSKKKKKKRSRTKSRSSSSSDSRYSYSHFSKRSKSKKKHRQRSKSRSRSSERYSRRERSPDRKRRSRSGSRSRGSKLYDRGRRSRSYERSRHTSRDRRSRSDSRDRTYSRRRSPSRDRSRRSQSYSTSRDTSRKSSPDQKKGKQMSPASAAESLSLTDIPGFQEMTPSEQAQVRMKLALKAAVAADEQLRERAATSSPSCGTPNPLTRQQFSDAVASIEADSFVPSTFKSGRSSKNLKETLESGDMSLSSSHSMAMFGAVGSSVVFTKTEPLEKGQAALEENPENLFDRSILEVTAEEKMKRWIQKLTSLRKKRRDEEYSK